MTACLAMYNIGTTVSHNANKFQPSKLDGDVSVKLENKDPTLRKEYIDSNSRIEDKGILSQGAVQDVSKCSTEKTKGLGITKGIVDRGNSIKEHEMVEENGSGTTHPDPAPLSNGSSTSSAVQGVQCQSSKDGSPVLNPAPAPIPVLKGTLSYNLEQRRHNIRGNWSYENTSSTAMPVPKQRFEYLRNLSAEEDVKTLPMDGEYHGSFNISHVHTNTKGKRKEKTTVHTETGVIIRFTKKEECLYEVNGQGRNDYGVFELNGHAKKSDDISMGITFDIVLTKKYQNLGTTLVSKKSKKSGLKRKHGNLNGSVTTKSTEPLPPSESHPKGVVCLKGNLRKTTEEDGGPQVIHKIDGMWGGGLDKLLEDPQNLKGLCNPFAYEHKCTYPADTFPLSGRYTGWFLYNKENGERVTVQERDVHLKFRKNTEGNYNVEGRGMNIFGKYTITGTLSKDNEITIFRHFMPMKKAKPSKSSSNAPTILQAPQLPLTGKSERPVSTSRSGDENLLVKTNVPRLSLDDVVAPEKEDDPPPAMAPLNGTIYSRGVLKVGGDGGYECKGKWALNKELYEKNKSANFNFGLTSQDVSSAVKAIKGESHEEKEQQTVGSFNAIAPDLSSFPLDSCSYYGFFRMNKGSSKASKVLDQQIVLKFRENSVGSFNVYGIGVNEFGKFDLVGTFLPRAEGTGQIELYRVYHPIQQTNTIQVPTGKQLLTPTELENVGKREPLNSLSGKIQKIRPHDSTKDSDSEEGEIKSSISRASGSTGVFSPDMPVSNPNSILPNSSYMVPTNINSNSISPHPISSNHQIMHRSSSRQTKIPSRLEEDDPKVLHQRIMDRCVQLLRYMIDKDEFNYFVQAVDPVALDIPTYHTVIKNPMDLGTVMKKLQANEIESHYSFGKLVRLVFNNAMTFNVDVTHRVHQSARDMLQIFNQKFKDIEKDGERLEDLKKNNKSDRDLKKRDKKLGKDRKKNKDDLKSRGKRERDERLKEHKGRGGSTKRTKIENSEDYVSRSEFDAVVKDLKYVKNVLEAIVSQFASTGVIINIPKEEIVQNEEQSDCSSKKNIDTGNPKGNNSKNKAETPLTREEQIELTEIINKLPEHKVQGVMEILKKDMGNNFGGEEEVDLEIDQLNTSTQRELQRYVKQEKKPKPTPRMKTKKNNGSEFAQPKVGSERQNDKSSNAKNNDCGNSDNSPKVKTRQEPVEDANGNAFTNKPFKSDDEDTDSDSSFDLEKPFYDFKHLNKKNHESDNDSEDENDPFEDAKNMTKREQIAAQQRKESEEKVRKDAEIATQKRLKELADRSKDVLAQQEQQALKDAQEKKEEELKEEEKKQKLRDELRRKRDHTTKEFDLDAQRKIMEEYEESYGHGGSGSNSPEDFGF